MADPYEILDVARDADRQRVHAAFREKAREHHPDLDGDREAFKRVKRAYEELDEELRDSEPGEPSGTSDASESAEAAESSSAPSETGASSESAGGEPRRLDDGATDLPAAREGGDGEVEPATASDDARPPAATASGPEPGEGELVHEEPDGDRPAPRDPAEADAPATPADASASPPDASSPADASQTGSEATTADAETTTGDAEATTADAAASTADADASTADAEASTADAATSTADPGAATADPDADVPAVAEADAPAVDGEATTRDDGDVTAADEDGGPIVDDRDATEFDDGDAAAPDEDDAAAADAALESGADDGEEADADDEDGAVDDEPAREGPEQTVFWDRDVDPITSHLEDTPTGDPVAGARSDLDVLDRKINEWKSQLLDLTRRNDLIHLVDPPKTKSLPLDEDDPTVVAAGGAAHGSLSVRKRTEDAVAGEVERESGEADRELDDADEPGETPDADRDGAEAERPPAEVLPVDEPTEAERRLNDIRLKHKQHLRERGVDSLYLALGKLRWYALEDADREYQSPLFLVPVELEEQTTTDSERHNYALEVATDDLVVNPALRKKLLADWRISLPADEELSLAEIDTAFESVYTVVEGLDRWVIEDDVLLGIFDFTKVSLYNDLEENRERIKEHPIVRALVGETDELHAAEGDIETPTAEELDDVVDPADTFQVLDADSSQQEAIEAANRGKSFVLQGPPGTGKSQTIANIVAEKLARGETVLFVSEKQAALNVVKNRLDDAGIGRFCLEAHGTKASKHSVLDSLESELQSGRIMAPDDRPAQLDDLRELRETMREYGEDLFYSPKGWDLTVYEALGAVSAHDDLPRVETGIDDALAVGQERLDAALEALGTLAEFEGEIADHHSNPWRHTTLTEVPVDVQSAMEESIESQTRVLQQIRRHAADLESSYDLPVDSLARYRDAAAFLYTLSNRPRMDWRESYLDPDLVAEVGRIEQLADLAQRRAELRDDLEGTYRQSFFELDGTELYDRISEFGMLRSVKPAYRSLRSKVLDHATADYSPGHDELRDDLQKLSELQGVEDRLEEFSDLTERLGADYRSDRLDWDDLVAGVSWADAFLDHPDEFVEPVLERLVEGSLPDAGEDGDRADELLDDYADAAEFFEDAMATGRMRVDGGDLEDAAFDALIERLEELASRVDDLPSRIRYENRLQAVRDTVAETYVDNFLAEWHPPSVVVDGFEKAFFTQWLNETYADTDLGSFSTADMDRTIRQFRRLDREQLQLASVAIQHEVTASRPELDMQHSPSSEQQIVRREVGKQRNHKPLRELFDEAGSYIEHLTPCLMMSPLSVAQYLPADAIEFDAVIFDEASQIMPEDAISSIIRADQAIVAGDSKQLPPTSFFESSTETTEDVREDLESVLKELAAVLPEKHLRWHYRSRTQDLIQFSNATYYDDSLQVFPENQPDVETGISFVYVEDGVYDRGGTRRNEVEAERVVDEIQAHAAEHPEKSLGVVAFSKAQEQAIRDELEARIDDDPVLESFVNQDDILDEFFVKNLEMVQGDERDRMLFSVGYGPDEDGDLTMNFGPLNQTGGERRLNVAVTRARERITVVSSVKPEDIDLDRTSSRGVADFKRYLEYAKRASRDRGSGPTAEPEDFESAFERSVYTALQDTDMHVERVGTAANYSLDLGIKPDPDAEAYALGIQCDGAAYRHSKTARDRERTRPSVLTDLGWDVHRVWSPSWVSDRERELELIREKVFEDDADPYGTKYDEFPVPVEEHAPVAEETSGDPMAHADIDTYESPDLPPLQDRALDDVPPETLRSDLADVVADHGPLREDVAYRAILEQWEVPRLDAAARETMSACANHLEQEGELVQHDGFLWPEREALSFAVRQPGEDARREIDEIPHEELLKAMAILLAAGGTMEVDDLQLETARLFGYQRRGSRIRSQLDRAIELGEDCGVLEVDDRVALVEGVDVDASILERVYR